LLMAWALLAPALAQIFPERTSKIIVPQSPGGGFDTPACVLADRLSPFFGRPRLGKTGRVPVRWSWRSPPCVAARRPTSRFMHPGVQTRMATQ
jgi:hypothetical protein